MSFPQPILLGDGSPAMCVGKVRPSERRTAGWSHADRLRDGGAATTVVELGRFKAVGWRGSTQLCSVCEREPRRVASKVRDADRSGAPRVRVRRLYLRTIWLGQPCDNISAATPGIANASPRCRCAGDEDC